MKSFLRKKNISLKKTQQKITFRATTFHHTSLEIHNYSPLKDILVGPTRGHRKSLFILSVCIYVCMFVCPSRRNFFFQYHIFLFHWILNTKKGLCTICAKMDFNFFFQNHFFLFLSFWNVKKKLFTICANMDFWKKVMFTLNFWWKWSRDLSFLKI